MSETRDLTIPEALAFGIELLNGGRGDDAERMFRTLLEVDPQNANAQNLLGICLTNRRSYYEAMYRFERALKLGMPSRAGRGMVMSNLGMILSELGHYDEACNLLRSAVTLCDKVEPWNNLGNVCERLGKYGEALRAFDRVLALDPDHTLTHFNVGVVYLRQGRRRDAIASFDRAILLDPQNADARYNRGSTLLSLGDFRPGFADYEYRLKTSEGAQPYYVDAKSPKWAGEDLTGKSILLHAEQGIGDTIQFLRYVPLVYGRGAKVHLIVHSALIPLVRETYGEIAVVHAPGEPMPETDYHSPLLSLPFVFGTTIATVPEPARFAIRRCKLSDAIHGHAGGKLKVGICWSGNFKHKNDAHRSIPLKTFAPILDADAAFFSLQKEVREVDADAFRGLRALDLSRHLTDFAETAAVIAKLDLVVTVDTAVAHMAGSIGVPTFILIPGFCTDWRWMTGRSDSPWYPSAKLFRQAAGGDWAAAIRDVKENIRREASDARLCA